MQRPDGNQILAGHLDPEFHSSLDGNNVTLSNANPLSQTQLGNMLITKSHDQLLKQLQDQIIKRSQGQIMMQPQGQIMIQSQSQTTNQPQGQISMQSPGQIRMQTPGQIMMQSQGQIGMQPQGQIMIQSQGQTRTQPQGQIMMQSQGQIGMQPQGQIMIQSQGQTRMQPQGQIGMQPRGQIMMQSQDQTRTQPLSQIKMQSQGQITMPSKGQITTQPQGQITMQSQGQITMQSHGPIMIQSKEQIINRPKINPSHSFRENQSVLGNPYASRFNLQPVKSGVPTNQSAAEPSPVLQPLYKSANDANIPNRNCNSSNVVHHLPMQLCQYTASYANNRQNMSSDSLASTISYKEHAPATMNYQNSANRTDNLVIGETNKSLSGQQCQYSAVKKLSKWSNAHDERPGVDSNTQALLRLPPHATFYQLQSSATPLQNSREPSVADHLSLGQQNVKQSEQQGVNSHVQRYHPTATMCEQQSLTTTTTLKAQRDVSPSAVEYNPKIPEALSADDYRQNGSIHRSSDSSGQRYCEPCARTFSIAADDGHPFSSLFKASVNLGDFIAVDFQGWQNWSTLLNMDNVVKLKSRGALLYECLMCMQETSKPAFFHFHIYKHLVAALPPKCSHCAKKEYVNLKTVVDNLFYFITKVLTKVLNTEHALPGMSYLKGYTKIQARKPNALNEDCEVGSSSPVQREYTSSCQPSTMGQTQLCEPDTTSDVRSLNKESCIADTTSTSVGCKDNILTKAPTIPDSMDSLVKPDRIVAKTAPELSDVAEYFLMNKVVDRINTDTPSLPVSGEKRANQPDNIKRPPLFKDKLAKLLNFDNASNTTSDHLYSASQVAVTNAINNSKSATNDDSLITVDRVVVKTELTSTDVAECSPVDKDVGSKNASASGTVQFSDKNRGTLKSDTPPLHIEDVLTALPLPPIINANSQAETEETLDAIAQSMLNDMYGVNVDDGLMQIKNVGQDFPIVRDTNASDVLPNECLKSVSPMLHVDEHEGWFYACGFPQCFFSYAYLSQLRTHFVSSHAKEIGYPCIYCQKLCTSAESLLRHIHVHANKTMFLLYLCTAKNCKFGSNKLSELEDHLQKLHASDGSFRCKKCLSKFQIIADLIFHLQKNVLKFVQCHYCGAKHKKRSVILEHIRVDHPDRSLHVMVTSQLLCQKSGLSNQNKNCSPSELATCSNERLKDASRKNTDSYGKGHNTKVLLSTKDAKHRKRRRGNDIDDLCKENPIKRHKAFASRSDQEKIFKNLDIALLPCYIATSSAHLRCLVCDLEDSWKHRLLTHIMVKHLGVLLYACSQCGYRDLMYSGTRHHIKTVHKGKAVTVKMAYPENIRDIAVNFMSTFKHISSQTDLTTGHPIVPDSQLENGGSILIDHRSNKNTKIVRKKLLREMNHLDYSLKLCYVSLSDHKYKCKICNLIDSWKHRLHNHIMKRHLDIKLFQCSYCGFKDGAYTITRKHISRVHQGKSIRVKKVFPADLRRTAADFVAALKPIDERATDSSPCLSRKKTETLLLEAPKAKSISKSQNDLVDVALRPCLKEIPNGQFKCIICGSEKRKKERLHRHIIVKHLGLLMYPCPYCQYADITEETAKAHIIKQHRNKPLKVDKCYPNNLGEIVETFMAAFRRMNTGFKNEMSNAIYLTMDESASPDVRDNKGKEKRKFRLKTDESSSSQLELKAPKQAGDPSQEPEYENIASLHEEEKSNSQSVVQQSEHGHDVFIPNIVVKKGKIRPNVYERCQAESWKQAVRPRLDKRMSAVCSTEQHGSDKPNNEYSRKDKKERKLLRYCCHVCNYISINIKQYKGHLGSHFAISQKEQDLRDKSDSRSVNQQYACVHCMFLGPSLNSLHLHCKHMHPGKIVAMRQIAKSVDKKCTHVNLVPLLKITDLATMNKCKQQRLLFDCHVKHLDLSALPYLKFQSWMSIFG